MAMIMMMMIMVEWTTNYSNQRQGKNGERGGWGGVLAIQADNDNNKCK